MDSSLVYSGDKLPRAVLLDLDDTILNDSGNADHCWKEACLAHRSELGRIDPTALLEAIDRTRKWYWADPQRHRVGRLDLDKARRDIVNMSFAEMGVENVLLAAQIADDYSRQRDALVELLPEAVETVRWLRVLGCRLALLTNGNAAAQRAKINRFGLHDLFDAVLIEGELGFGKPDPRIYELALRLLTVAAGETWMIGDNLEWDVTQPQKMGIVGIWIDFRGIGLPKSATVRPNHVVRALSELQTLADLQTS